MKYRFAAGIAVVALVGICGAAGAQAPLSAPAEEGFVMAGPGSDSDLWEMEVQTDDLFVTPGDGPQEDVLVDLAHVGGPDGLMDVVQAEGPGGGMMGGGPGPMMGPGGPPPAFQRRMKFFHGGPMMGMRMGGPMGMMGGMMLERARQALGLTDEQVNRLRDLHMAARKDMIRGRAEAQIAQMDLQEILRQTNPRPEEVKTRVSAVNNIRSQMLEKRVNARLEMQKVFTPEQREKVKNFMMHRGMGGKGSGGGHGWGGGWKPKAEPKAEPKQ